MFKKSLLVSIFTIANLLFVGSVMAANLTVQISDLPEYENTDNFKLSYTALQFDYQPITAQFTCQKEGFDWHNVGGVINGENGSAETDHSIIDSEGKYNCRVDVTSNGETISSYTSTTVDWSAPNAPSDYGKEKINSNTYRLTWKTPNADDFDYVAVYRYTEQNFIADSGSLVAQVPGVKDTKIIWENTGLEINKNYFYALRAVDKAGNASNLAGDGGTVTTTVVNPTLAPGQTVQAGQTGNGVQNVNQLPKEGKILGESTGTSTPTPTQTENTNNSAELSKEQTNGGNNNLPLIIGGLIVLVLGGYFFLRQRPS